MGTEELNRTVRGQGGTLATSTSGVVETDNYDQTAAFNIDPTNDSYVGYPHTVDPAGFTIQFLKILETGTDIRADIVTKTGDTASNVNLRGAGLEEGSIEISSITFRDPNETGEPTFGYFSGE